MKILKIVSIDHDSNSIELVCEGGLKHTWKRLKGFNLDGYEVGQQYITIGVMIYRLEFGL